MMDGWDWFWGVLMMVAFWGGIAAVVVIAVRAFGTSRRPDHPDAKAILRNRYARGEISEEEFETHITVLDSRAA
jgi:uncharacterized membrane protein